jgi:hypothetical protein
LLSERIDRNRFARLDGLLSSEAHGDGPAAVGRAAGELASLAYRADQHRHLIFQLENFARDFVDRDLLNLFAIECPQRKRGM